MNINDIPIEGLLQVCYNHYGVDDPLAVIFARQQELIEKYLPVEEEILGRSLPALPFDLHNPICQEALKARAWWFTEEIGEAFDALSEGLEDKFLEECSDALHFLTELMILSGVGWGNIASTAVPNSWMRTLEPALTGSPDLIARIVLRWNAFAVVGELAMAMWQLRNKPWKRTQVLTDEWHYRERLITTYGGFLNLLMTHCGLDLGEIAILYLRKSEVNKFRIRSNY